MGNIYCIYKNQKYKARISGQKIRITAKEKQEGFKNYIDILGNEHMDLFMKEIRPEETELVYEEKIIVRYEGEYFQLFAGEVTQQAVLDNAFMIWTDAEELADRYGFEKKEQFVFVKNITREEIQAVKVIKHPLLCFKNEKVQEEILKDEKLMQWFNNK